jgi:uncharacterized Zn finger protein
MAFRGFGVHPPYVPVAERRARGERELAKLVKTRGRPAAPVVIEGREIATTFWGKAWCENLAAYSDFASRLPRGRTYVRNGSVLDLHLAPGRVEAHVAGSELYRVEIDVARLPAPRWRALVKECAGQIASLIGLLRGELSPGVLAVLTRPRTGLFPAPAEITMRCSCPDAARLCKHLAAVLYGVGARLDTQPELFFTLRQVDQAELIAGAGAADVLAAAGAAGGQGKSKRLAGKDLGALFGIELDESPPPRRAAKGRIKARARAK